MVRTWCGVSWRVTCPQKYDPLLTRDGGKRMDGALGELSLAERAPAPRLWQGDCLVCMAEVETASVDMVLCDLPYGVTKNKWDVVLPLEELWKHYKRILKPNGLVVLFGVQPFTSLLVTSNPKDFRYSLVWEKNKFSDFLNAKVKPMRVHEDILVFYKKRPTYNPQYTYGEPYKRWNTQEAVDKQTNYGRHRENVAESKDGRRLPTSVLKFARVERPQHPTQKPVELCEWLVRTYTNEGDTVLDHCMGAGTTGVACARTGRRFLGMELDATYFGVAKENIQAAVGFEHDPGEP